MPRGDLVRVAEEDVDLEEVLAAAPQVKAPEAPHGVGAETIELVPPEGIALVDDQRRLGSGHDRSAAIFVGVRHDGALGDEACAQIDVLQPRPTLLGRELEVAAELSVGDGMT
jgi:hypothetical protein